MSKQKKKPFYQLNGRWKATQLSILTDKSDRKIGGFKSEGKKQ